MRKGICILIVWLLCVVSVAEQYDTAFYEKICSSSEYKVNVKAINDYRAIHKGDIWGVVVGITIRSSEIVVLIVYLPPRSNYNSTTGQVEWTPAVTEHVRLVGIRPYPANVRWKNPPQAFVNGINIELRKAEPVSFSGTIRAKVYLDFDEFVGLRDKYGHLLCLIDVIAAPKTMRSRRYDIAEKLLRFGYVSTDMSYLFCPGYIVRYQALQQECARYSK